MCGLAGFIDLTGRTGADELHATALRMADTLRHRGPDDRGSWADAEAGVALGFRRLSIVDLSPEGHQPMASVAGRYVLVFNGEIYNHVDLRRELKRDGGPPFRGHSDTEVMLAAIERWGLKHALGRFIGMFAFALWDRHGRTLHLGRDRLGEKPLYYGQMDGTFLFGSELKALRAHPRFRGVVNRDALALYMRYGYVPAPHSIYEGIGKLSPGTTLTVAVDGAAIDPQPVVYWSAADVAMAGAADPFEGTEEEAANRLEALLCDSVGRQMVADVPLGAFLSGGIDSSTVVAMMQAQSPRPVRTYTIGFEEVGYDEARHAEEVARHLGTEHTEMYVTPMEAREIIPELPSLYDEPFADPSAIPFHLVSRLARQDVTVCLSGDGGDELFGGYPWYPRTQKIWNKVRWVPGPLRKAAASALVGLPERGVPMPWLAHYASCDRTRKLAELMTRASSPEGVHQALRSQWGDTPVVVLGAATPPTSMDGWKIQPGLDDAVARAMLVDLSTYLPDDILTKVDRASMGVSLESRAPLLDYRLVEFALRMPTAMKIRGDLGKRLLRRVLYKYIPRELIERPKMGFSVPIGAWLRGPLRGWAESLLDETRIRQEGLFNPDPIRRRWAEHLSGSERWSDHLWHTLMFQAWLESMA